MTDTPLQSHLPADFRTTRWTRVCLAKTESEDGRRALSDLCDAYYEPVMAYLRTSVRNADAARDMSHAFFADVLSGGAIATADPARGRFRYYLLGAVKHFLAHHWEKESRLKRGGGATLLSIHAELDTSPALDIPADARQSPEAIYDRQWAITLLARAMTALTEECTLNGKSDLLLHLRPTLLGEAEYGDLAASAAELQMSVPALKVAAHRLRQRFRHCVKAEVAGTQEDPSTVEDEMRALFVALGG